MSTLKVFLVSEPIVTSVFAGIRLVAENLPSDAKLVPSVLLNTTVTGTLYAAVSPEP